MSFFFILMADVQFGCFAELSQWDQEKKARWRRNGYSILDLPRITGFTLETELYEKAVEETNRLSPDFVVMCGDMLNSPDDPSQYAELVRITRKLHENVPMYWVAGNHDLNNRVTMETLGWYRQRFGADNYYFDHKGCRFIVINSYICVDSSNVPGEWEALVEFLETALREASETGMRHVFVISHHPLFIDRFHEAGSNKVVPQERRRVLYGMFRRYHVAANFAGHWHMNVYAQHDGIASIASGSIGYPLGKDPSGFRVVKLYEDRFEHEYFALSSMPDAITMEKPSDS